MIPARKTTPALEALTGLFYDSLNELGDFEEVPADVLPEIERKLLAHDAHMTVAVESHHGCPVDVKVLKTELSNTHYARKILLTRSDDGRVVQYGIVRLSLACLTPVVRDEIEQQNRPLGRILIDHKVLREVMLVSLWKIAPGKELKKLLGLEEGSLCYGRSAFIYFNGLPAVELLEIVTP